MAAMVEIDVAFSPRDVVDVAQSVYIVVDVIRASTSMITLFARGCRRLYVARTLESGRHFARSTGRALCGERNGAKPDGFDYGNSPTEFAGERFDGCEAVLCTTNGTVALHAVAASPAVFVGCLANATATVSAATSVAEAVGRITILCSASYGHFAFDDAWTAGRLVALAWAAGGNQGALTDAARAALLLTKQVPDSLEALRSSRSARALQPLGLEADVVYAAEEDRSSVTPRLVTDESSDVPYPVFLVPDTA